MANIELAPECHPWHFGQATNNPPADQAFLEAITRGGFAAFTGPSGLCGGKSAVRSVIVIHRGRGSKWEVIFRENETDLVTTTTTDLAATTNTFLAWLRGASLVVDENSVHSIAG